MAAVLDFRSSETYIGQYAPINFIEPGDEVSLCTLSFDIPQTADGIVFWTSVGWQAASAFTTLLFRIRRGNPTTGAVIFGTFDSQFVNNRTFSSVNTELVKTLGIQGTTQTYYLTAQLTAGAATISGPVNLTGFVMG